MWGVLSVELRVHQATCCGQFYYDGREESGTGPDIDLQTCILPPNTNTNTNTGTNTVAAAFTDQKFLKYYTGSLLVMTKTRTRFYAVLGLNILQG